jgi:hypothetical protein
VLELTRGGLQPAAIYECVEDRSQVRKKTGGKSVKFMFNPTDYSVSKKNKYEAKPKNKANTPNMEFKNPESTTLSLKGLVFDSYEELNPLKQDISKVTRVLLELMDVIEDSSDSAKSRPAPVVFEWGKFQFFAVITGVTQKFTLFTKDGTPVRAEVDVDLSQHLDNKLYKKTNPTSGGGPLERVWQVRAGDRLDLIAAQVYGDSQKWRLIAARNGLHNPLLLRAGQSLRIPQD